MATTKRRTPKLNIKKGDMVFIRSGDDKGKKGRVIEIITKDMKALVEGINIVSRHTKPNATNTNGGIIKKEAPIYLSKLSLIDAKGQPTRVGRMLVDGKSVRYSKKSKDKKEIIK